MREEAAARLPEVGYQEHHHVDGLESGMVECRHPRRHIVCNMASKMRTMFRVHEICIICKICAICSLFAYICMICKICSDL